MYIPTGDHALPPCAVCTSTTRTRHVAYARSHSVSFTFNTLSVVDDGMMMPLRGSDNCQGASFLWRGDTRPAFVAF